MYFLLTLHRAEYCQCWNRFSSNYFRICNDISCFKERDCFPVLIYNNRWHLYIDLYRCIFAASWRRHQIETFSTLLTLCAGNSPVTLNSPHKGQRGGALEFSLICALNKRLSRQSWGCSFETPPCSSWRHCDVTHSTYGHVCILWYIFPNDCIGIYILALKFGASLPFDVVVSWYIITLPKFMSHPLTFIGIITALRHSALILIRTHGSKSTQGFFCCWHIQTLCGYSH